MNIQWCVVLVQILSWIKQKGAYHRDILTEYAINIFKLNMKQISWNKFFITDNDCIYLS